MKHPWQLADENIPADVREMAKRWEMEGALLEMWRGSFIEGYRYRKSEQVAAMQATLEFLNSIEGAGYGGMASFEIARQFVREACHEATRKTSLGPTPALSHPSSAGQASG